jgi:hypothetical protein
MNDINLQAANRKIQSIYKILETMELARLGIWEAHKPALDSILLEFHKLGFELDATTVSDLTANK